MGGKDVTILGEDIVVGQDAPTFALQNQDWEVVDVLEATKGKVRIFTALPSLATGVCDLETRTFNKAASELDENIVIVGISMDLPYAQKNWCGAAGVERVLVLSDHLEAEFGMKYGCLIKERRILRRAVFVVDANNKVAYVHYMESLGNEPDYDAVLNAARSVLP
ncbi:MAG: thiol peroxidase [Chloroflexi bacterium]|nr:thiol peroxidase [Chloroflexota bacterium]MBT3668685.1 thiol peroxidase [Chloroflexota bacterium]MBT4003518.1 thiol peroxidase [Chloroflexota bacterium]MBT4305386.1 thiol peroxidase [Chloroflexota bacterium]MBT4532532.1 thiol peroxidase [Chloroflexota bacterium]